jgi:hypothetical protein
MDKERVIRIIDDKLKKIEEANTKNILKGSLNVGVHLDDYKDSTQLQTILKKRKRLNTLLWVETFSIPALVIITFSDVLDGSFIKGILLLLAGSLFAGLIFVYLPLHGLISFSNDMQKDVKKMMLEDLKNKIQELPD